MHQTLYLGGGGGFVTQHTSRYDIYDISDKKHSIERGGGGGEGGGREGGSIAGVAAAHNREGIAVGTSWSTLAIEGRVVWSSACLPACLPAGSSPSNAYTTAAASATRLSQLQLTFGCAPELTDRVEPHLESVGDTHGTGESGSQWKATVTHNRLHRQIERCIGLAWLPMPMMCSTCSTCSTCPTSIVYRRVEAGQAGGRLRVVWLRGSRVHATAMISPS